MWKWTKGANWKQPKGPNSTIIGIENHPVVHISFQDTNEYEKWYGKRYQLRMKWNGQQEGA